MNAERWAQVDRLLDEALLRAPEARATYLAEVCAADEALRQEVASLLAAHDRAEAKFLAAPALEVAAQELAAQTNHSLVGQTLGPYSVLLVLGVGGMGEVYLAHDLRLNRKLALKLLPRQYTADAERVRRFEREAHAVSALNHPNIITVYDIGQFGTTHYIAAEYVDGQTLRQRLTHGRVPVKEALEFTVQIASALAAAHEAGTVHRDIKPENVMVRRDGYVKVLDFGLAKLMEQRASIFDTRGSGAEAAKTAPGAVLGTVRYMSPEQALGQEVDRRSDLFSLGVMLYELLTGTPPFKGATTADLLDAIVHHQPLPLTQAEPTLSSELEFVINRALEKDRELRYQTAQDLRAALKRVQRAIEASDPNSPASTNSGAAPSQRGAPLNRHLKLWGVAAIALLASLNFFAWRYFTKGRSEPSPWLEAVHTLVADNPDAELFPSLAPDGKSLVYARQVNDQWDIFSQRIGGSNAQNLTANSPDDDTQPALSPDGERIAFYSRRAGGGIYLMGASGEAPRRLVAGPAYHPAWSPDGKQLLYTEELIYSPSDRSARPSHRCWVINVATQAKHLVSTEDVAQPQWSPDGGRIAYWGSRGNAQRDIWTMTADGHAPVEVTNDAALDWNPVWSPDGRYLYFASDRNGSFNLFRIALDQRTGQVLGAPELVPTPSPYSQHISFSRDGKRLAFVQVNTKYRLDRWGFDPARAALTGSVRNLLKGPRNFSGPNLSPDGTLLAFYGLLSGTQEDIAVVKTDGTGQPQQLTDDKFKDRGPQWSPDGKRLAFYTNRDEAGWGIWTVNADGGNLRPLVPGSEEGAYFPLWSPDGKQLIFTSRAGVPFIISVEHPVPQPLLPALDPQPSFWVRERSADGKQLFGAWRLKPDDTSTIVIYALATKQFTPLPSIDIKYAHWLHDNRQLLFVANEKLTLFNTQTHRQREVSYADARQILSITLARDDRTVYLGLEIPESDIWLLTRQ